MRGAVYGATPILIMCPPVNHEMERSCNGCNAPSVTSVLELGRSSERGSSATVTMLCGLCTRMFKGVVSDFAVRS